MKRPLSMSAWILCTVLPGTACRTATERAALEYQVTSAPGVLSVTAAVPGGAYAAVDYKVVALRLDSGDAKRQDQRIGVVDASGHATTALDLKPGEYEISVEGSWQPGSVPKTWPHQDDIAATSEPRRIEVLPLPLRFLRLDTDFPQESRVGLDSWLVVNWREPAATERREEFRRFCRDAVECRIGATFSVEPAKLGELRGYRTNNQSATKMVPMLGVNSLIVVDLRDRIDADLGQTQLSMYVHDLTLDDSSGTAAPNARSGLPLVFSGHVEIENLTVDGADFLPILTARLGQLFKEMEASARFREYLAALKSEDVSKAVKRVLVADLETGLVNDTPSTAQSKQQQ